MSYSATEVAAQLLAAGAGVGGGRAGDTDRRALADVAAEVVERPDAETVIRHLALAAGVLLDIAARSSGQDPAAMVRQMTAALQLADDNQGGAV